MDKSNISYSLHTFADCGIGAVEITPIYGVQGNEDHDIDFLSPEWMQMLDYTMAVADSVGIIVDMNCGTGWPFGGPQVSIEDAACKVVVIDTIVTQRVAKRIMKDPMATLANALKEKDREYAKVIAASDYSTSAKGQRRIIVLMQCPTRQKVKRAAPGGEGWVMDHFSRTAVKNYLSRFTDAFRSMGERRPRAMFNDSYEVYNADWTPTLPEEFLRRRGYDLLSKLREFADADTLIMSDYRETLAELLHENFTQQWTQWAHSEGMITRNQAHGSPANLIDIYATVDIPEIEGFGLSDFNIKGLRRDDGHTRPNYSDLSMLKYAPSAAHITGRRLASSESFTWLTEHFRTSLSQMKPDLDLLFCAGVNHIFFHGACYSPKEDAWPGWRFYASIDMSPTNSIWRDAPNLMRYISRCQHWLQAGEPDNDVLVMLPVRNMWQRNIGKRLMQFDIHSMSDKAPEFINTILSIDSLGYDCDYISEQILLKTKAVNGKIKTEGGAEYKALVIPGEDVILSEKAQKHIENLQKDGVHIIYNICARGLQEIGKPEEIKSKLGLKMIRRRLDGGHLYFIANLTPEDIDEYVSLNNTGKTALYDPMTDAFTVPAVLDGKIRLALRSGESVFAFVDIDTDLSREITQGETKELYDSTEIMTQFSTWKLSFIDSEPAVVGTTQLPVPRFWEGLDLPNASTMMGTGVYETTFRIAQEDIKRGATMRLMLGDVRESARVIVNGEEIGCAWAAPFSLDFSSDILKAKNTLRIEVTNLPANRIADYDRRGIAWRKFKEINVVDINYKKTTYEDWPPVASGLNELPRLFMLH